MDGQPKTLRSDFDGRRLHRHATSRGTIRLADHRHHLRHFMQRFQRWHGNFRRSKK
jgi:hypothetical protein